MTRISKAVKKPSPEMLWEDSQGLSLSALWNTFLLQPKSFWCACAYLFFEYVRPQTIYPWLDILPWPLLAIGFCLLFSIQENQKNPPSGGIGSGLALMSAAVIMSSILATYPSLSFQNFRAFFDWIIIYVVIKRAVNSEAKFFLFTVLFFLANFKMTQHGFLSWATRGFAFESWGVTGGPGWFHNSGEFGIQICIFVPMLTACAIAMRQLWSTKVQFIIGMILLTGIGSAIATSSRGALVGLAAAFVWMAMRSKYFIRAAAACSIFGLVIYLNIPEESMERFRSSGSDGTSLHRIERWQHGWEAMKEHPVFGVGFKNWEVYYPKHFSPNIPGPAMVHNIFVEAGTELGFFGLLTFLSLIYICFFVTKKVRKLLQPGNDHFLIGMSYGLDAALIGMLISSCFVTVFYYPYFWIHCLFVSCLFAASHNKYSTQPRKSHSRIRKTQA